MSSESLKRILPKKLPWPTELRYLFHTPWMLSPTPRPQRRMRGKLDQHLCLRKRNSGWRDGLVSQGVGHASIGAGGLISRTPSSINKKLGVVACACNPRAWEAETCGSLRLIDQCRLLCKIKEEGIWKREKEMKPSLIKLQQPEKNNN